MDTNLAQMKIVSSLDKVRLGDDVSNLGVTKLTALKGESVNFQVYVKVDLRSTLPVRVESELSDFATLYQVKDTIIDFIWFNDDDVITDKPGIVPDILIPLCDQNGFYSASKYGSCMWVNVKVPEYFKAGEYDFTVYFGEDSASLKIEIVDEVIEENTLKYTQWFHPDCIASCHNVAMYSEEHWKLIENYMLLAKDTGINMVLIPSISTFYISQKLGNGKFFLIGDAIEGQFVANNLHFAAAIAFILMIILLTGMTVVKYVSARYVYGGE